MGTDIHAFVEYAVTPEPEMYACAGNVRLARDYRIFNVLGNGRNYGMPPEQQHDFAFISPRGAPSDISHWAAFEFYDLILGSSKPNQGDIPNKYFWNKDDCVTRKEAFHRAKILGSFMGEVRQTINVEVSPKAGSYRYPTWQAVAKDGYHSPSYLTFSEIEAAFAANGIVESELDLSFRALLTFMRTYASDPKTTAIRLLFWFDS